eukprot:9275186-Lingulodinium_polyedra.AAC.1
MSCPPASGSAMPSRRPQQRTPAGLGAGKPCREWCCPGSRGRRSTKQFGARRRIGGPTKTENGSK